MARRRWTRRDTALAAVTALAMEPATYLAHRYLMHGPGYGWHGEHHEKGPAVADRRVDRNDLFPVVFAGATIAVIAVGATIDRLRVLAPLGAGVTAYGAAYLVVHDLGIHRRWPRFTATHPVLERLADAHALHHRFGGEPYGFLAPVVPRAVRERDRRRPSTRTRSELLGGAPA